MFFDNNLIDKNLLRQVLNQTLSKKLLEKNLVWNGEYFWFNKSKSSIRQIFGYNLLKGEQGTFSWGVCLDFVPTIESGKVRYHKTDKGVKFHLFEWTEEYSNSFFGGNLKGGVTTHWGIRNAERSIKLLFEKYEFRINKWYDESSTIEQLIEVAERQIHVGNSYLYHSPNPKLILIFLLAKSNRMDLAIKMLNEYNIIDTEKELLSKELQKIQRD